MESNRRKVLRACERCRRQKLKCDIERPCTLCSRANAECIASESSRWRPYQITPKQTEIASNGPRNKPGVVLSSAVETAWNSSSTVKLVEEAFQQHDTVSPEGVQFSALRSDTWAQSNITKPDDSGRNDAVDPLKAPISQRVQGPQKSQNTSKAKLSAAEKELLSLLPGVDPATLLVDNYFSRIHWFMLLFHQDDFRIKFQNIYSSTSYGLNGQTSGRIGFLAVLLAALATSLHHISITQESTLQSYNVDAGALKDKILAFLKLRFLDIVSRGSLEAVQFCVLLGSYYLYNGEPEMAWPLCGSGLRIAQALNLHRKMPPGDPEDAALSQLNQDRKRAWWAVYEIEVFCSMLYGFPLGFDDSDCNVEPLDPYDEYSGSTAASRHTGEPTLLFYRCSMSSLSAIIKSALVDLYGTRNDDQKGTNRLRNLFDKVMSLNRRIQEWYRSLAPKLRFDNDLSDNRVPDDTERTGEEFEAYLFRLQALSLKLAYENARILIHRPLLSFKMVNPPQSTQKNTTKKPDPFQVALQECRDAALKISQVASTPYLLEASETYAITVVSLHLLTAGVTLCISISLDPSTSNPVESKFWMGQLMQVQNLLKEKSVVAAQSLDITNRLMTLVMAKGTNTTLDTQFFPTTEEQIFGTPIQKDRSENRSADHRDGSEQKPVPLQADIRTEVDPKLPPAMNNGSIIDTPSLKFADEDIDACVNASLNDTLLEYEQASNLLFTGDITYDPGDSMLDNPFLEQNQGWIWSWNFM